MSVNNPYVGVCAGAHKLLRSSFRPQSKGFPKERFLSMVLTRICKEMPKTKQHKYLRKRFYKYTELGTFGIYVDININFM